MKQLKNKILISIVMFFSFIICIINSSFSAYYIENGIDFNKYNMGGERSDSLGDYCLTTDDLRKYGIYKTGLSPTFIERSQIITDWLGKYAIQENRDLLVLAHKSPIHRYGMACIGHGNTDIYDNAPATLYRVEAIVDIDTATINSTGVPGVIKVYLPGKSAITGTSSTITFPFTRLAYLASKSVEGASQNKEPQTEADINNGKYDEPQYMEAQYDSYGNLKAHGNPYKMAISDIFYNNYGSLSAFGLSTKFSTTGPNAAKDYKSGGKQANTSIATQLTQVLNNATSYENQTKNYKFSVVSNNGNIVNLNGKSYLGPFKIQTSQGTISGATVSGYTVSGYTTSVGGTVSAISSIPNNSNFYIVINGTVNASSVNVTLTKTFTAYKARLVLLKDYHRTAYNGQSLMTYAGEQRILTNSITLTAKTGNLKIKKTDADTGTKLPNVEFKVYNTDISRYVVKNSNGSITFTTSESSATTFKTNTSGEFTVSKIPFGNYKVKEIKNPNAGYLTNVSVEKTGYVSIGSTKEISFTNKKQLVELTVKKVDATTGERLGNVSFSIKITSGDKKGKYLGYDNNGKATYYDTEHVMWTSASKDIVIKDVYIGNYELKEIQNLNDYYEKDVNKIVATGNITNTNDAKHTITVKNEREYIDITGTIWEDLPYIPNKNNEWNYLYKDTENEKLDINDKIIKNLQVYLIDKTIDTSNGKKNIVKTYKDGYSYKLNSDGKTFTKVNSEAYKLDENVSYIFEDVSIDKLQDYYIVFRYNGMVYKSVLVNTKAANANKATESTNRNMFNNNYATVTTAQANNVNGVKTYDLKYRTSNYKSEINYGNTDGDKYPLTGVDEQYYINANTWDAYSGGLNKIMTADTIRKNKVTKIENINLGVVKREQPDLSLDEDIYSARVEFGDEVHVYEYRERMNHTEVYGDGHELDPQVKFQKNTYSGLTYERPMYASDIKAATENRQALSLHVTYEVSVANASSNLKAKVNQITDYYDSKYLKALSYGTQINNDGSIKNPTNIAQSSVVTTSDGLYNKAVLNVNMELGAKQKKSVYIEFEVNPQELYQVINNADDDIVKLDNIVEISSYSIKDANGAVYAGIDIDSQPGNLDVNNITTYEDDTARAPGLSLVLAEERATNGKVFEDSSVNGAELRTGEIRQGDGEYKDGENGIKDVIVRLMDANTNAIAQIYDSELAKQEGQTGWKNAETVTDDNGNYEISGFLPGDYYIEYEWGSKTYKVQDYKSTVVNKNVWDANTNNKEWYKTEVDTRRSDAVDNYATRQNIDEQVKVVTNSSKTEIEKYEDGKIGEYEIIDKMKSKTPTFTANLEYSNTKTNVQDEYEKNSDGTLKVQNGNLVKKEGFKNIMRNIDFGIIERARQILDLNKNITNVKIVLANGTEVINTKVVDGVLENPSKYIVYLPESSDVAKIKVEIDSEIVQGATLEIGYKLGVTNISELEYATEEFYKYGTIGAEDKVVTLQANQIVDYLDNSMISSLDTTKWGVLEGTNKMKLIDDGFISTSENSRKFLESLGKVAISKIEGTVLKPNGIDTTTFELTGYKKLANNEEIIIENNAEIIKVTKTGGSSLQTTPGNFVPSDSSTREADDATSERLTIIPPTGTGINYISLIVLIISSLGILVAGIVLIKKYVLKK